ncbi:MAG TPA: AAA family ATPase [Acidimicrobiia bacterium]|jgi:DNA-binding CsgD family transcriptional regulator|nr:AAA family ATPase [Acidimicrobiia bacterium]
MASPRLPAFQGRTRERQVLDRLLETVHTGESAALVIRGEAGVGKTALLRYCARQASGYRVVQIAGIESEMELPYAGVHQLCAPLLDRLTDLPPPQQDALGIAFGLSSGAAPDRFLVALATLSLLALAAAGRPLLCLVDDAQWLDTVSGQIVGFVARRLAAESVAMVLALRTPSTERQLEDLPELSLGGLADEDARALLATVVRGRLDDRVRDRIIEETGGNPLALLELPRGMGSAELAGGFALPDARDLPDHLEEHYLRRIGGLPEATQQLMLVAAADPVGDAPLVWRAAETLGIGREAAVPAAGEQLLQIGTRVRFRHPLVRSALYRSASASDRRAAHGALAIATDPDADPDRWAWHRAQATSGPDDEVAAALARAAGRAQARGGLAAAAAFLERSANLTTDPADGVERLLAAAQCNVHAGAFDAAVALLAAVESRPLDEFGRARVELLRGRVASASSAGREAPARLLQAARRLEPLDPGLARETYLDAWGAALFAGRLADADVREVSRAARAAPAPDHELRPNDLLLDGLARLVVEGRAAATPTLREAVRAFRDEKVSGEQWLQWGVLASSAAVTLWDFDGWDAVSSRQIELARDAGALGLLSIALNGQGMIAAWSGDFEVAEALSAEDDAVREATGTLISPYGAMLLAAFRGRDDESSVLADATIEDAVARGEGLGVQLARWATAVVDNGLGRYEAALTAATIASDETAGLFISTWALPELIEASVRTGQTHLGMAALERLADATRAAHSDWSLGVEARSRALLSDDEEAEACYQEAVHRFSSTPLRPELARAQLLYGEWLRRRHRRVDAREQLRTAHELLAGIGMEAFAERARRELLATGEKVRKRSDDTRDQLTPQEAHIARLARDGRTNSEIGTELYISARTVEWHLRKVFTKLGIVSRKGLQDALAGADRRTAPA